MTFATLLRKNLLAVLRGQIIPDLHENSAPRLAVTHLPLQIPVDFSLREMPYPPLTEADATKVYPEGLRWDAVHMQALNYPALSCIVEGEADFLTGVTTSMLSRVPARDRPSDPRGGYIISAVAPAYILVPPGVPGRTGDIPPWHRPEPHAGKLVIFKARVLPVGALCHLTTFYNGVFHVQYSLLLKDDQLAPVINLLLDEQSTPAPNAHIVHAQMLTLMLRLERALSTQLPLMTDGLYSRFPDSAPTDSQAQPLYNPVIKRAHDYIQLRLHESLTPTTIAAHARLTPTQLNRIFKANTGLSTMNYVAKLRLESAQLLLRDSDLSVQEICRLVGYRQLAHFSRSFHRYAGQPPLKFRQDHERGMA
jgi:AraC-like DNA-binding protein